MSPEAILTFVASPVIGAAAAKFWQWWTTRDAAKLAAASDDAKARREALATERVDVIALLRSQIVAGEERGEKSAARADAMAAALHALAEQVRALNNGVGDVRDAMADHTHREESTLASIDARLSLLAPSTGEQPRASVVPGALRGPTPPRGVPTLPAAPAPPRRVP